MQAYDSDDGNPWAEFESSDERDDPMMVEPIDEYQVDMTGCRVDRYSPFAISIYGLEQFGVSKILMKIQDDTERLCKKAVGANYINLARLHSDNDLLFVLYYNSNREDETAERIAGFAVVADKRVRDTEDNSFYVDIICSNKEIFPRFQQFPGGKALLNAIVEFARAEGAQYVSLNALSHVVNYYRKFGFRFLKAGETRELPELKELAELNKNRQYSNAGQVNRDVLVERALMFAQEVDEDGNPHFNEELFVDELDRSLGLDREIDYSEAMKLYNKLPEHVRVDGSKGVHDLFFKLIKRGYADLIDKCPDITTRQFVKLEEVAPGVWKKWMTCDTGGVQMRKPLFPVDDDGVQLDLPIIDCEMEYMRGGRRKQRKRRTLRNRRVKPNKRKGANKKKATRKRKQRR